MAMMSPLRNPKLRKNKGPFMAMLWLYAATVAVFIKGASGVNSACFIRDTGGSGELTCLFTEDINATQWDIVVQRYGLNREEKRAVPVATCQWFKRDLRFGCKLLPGYTSDEKASHTFTVKMPALTKAHEGRYMCQVTNNGAGHDGFCTYEHPEKPPNSHQPDDSERQNNQAGGGSDSSESSREIIIFLAVFMSLSIIGNLVLITVIVYLVRFRRTQDDRAGTNDLQAINGQFNSLNERIDKGLKAVVDAVTTPSRVEKKDLQELQKRLDQIMRRASLINKILDTLKEVLNSPGGSRNSNMNTEPEIFDDEAGQFDMHDKSKDEKVPLLQ